MKAHNLIAIASEYRDGDRAREARKLLIAERKGKPRRKLDVLLRHHTEPPPIRSHETYERDSFDFLIGAYSLVEVASIACFVPDPLPRDFREEAFADLRHPAVRTYYEEKYPLRLPTLLCERLDGKGQDCVGDAQEASMIFGEFMELSRTRQIDPDVEEFLWFLDNGETAGVGLRDVLAVIESRARFEVEITKRPVEQRALQRALHGFRKFMTFCLDLDGLLARSAAVPLLRSSMWHYHSYWFRVLDRQVGETMRLAIKLLESWLSEDGRPTGSQQVLGAIERLTAGSYGAEVDSLFHSAVSERPRSAYSLTDSEP